MQLLGHLGLAWQSHFQPNSHECYGEKRAVRCPALSLADINYKNISGIFYTASRIGCWRWSLQRRVTEQCPNEDVTALPAGTGYGSMDATNDCDYIGYIRMYVFA
jgi:hypothetical protein